MAASVLNTVHCLQDLSELHTTAEVACGGDSNHNDRHKLAGTNKSFCVGDDCSRHIHTSRVSGARPNCVLSVTRRRRHQPIASTSKLALIIRGRSPNESITKIMSSAISNGMRPSTLHRWRAAVG